MRKIDIAVIDDVLNPLTKKIQRLTSIDCFGVSKMVHIFSVMLGLYMVYYFELVAAWGDYTYRLKLGSDLNGNISFGVSIRILIVIAIFNDIKSIKIGLPRRKQAAYEAVILGGRNPVYAKIEDIGVSIIVCGIVYLILATGFGLYCGGFTAKSIIAAHIIFFPVLCGYICLLLEACDPYNIFNEY